MKRNKPRAKDELIQSTSEMVMSMETTQEQNDFALAISSYGDGLRNGIKLGKLLGQPAVSVHSTKTAS